MKKQLNILLIMLCGTMFPMGAFSQTSLSQEMLSRFLKEKSLKMVTAKKTTTAANKKASAQPQEMILLSWNGSSYDTTGKTTYLYTGAQVQTQTDYMYGSGVGFIPISKESHTFNASGNINESVYQMWNGSSWENSMRERYEYDTHDNELAYYQDYWADSFWELDFSYKNDNSYSNDLLVEQIVSEYDHSTSAYNISGKTEMTYNAKGEAADVILYNYDQDMNKYEKMFKLSFLWQDYNAGLIKQLDWSTWVVNMWMVGSSTIYTYNSEDMMTATVTKAFDGTSMADQSKSEFSYDAYGNITRDESFEKQGSNWVLVGGEKTTYSYDAAHNVTVAEFTIYDESNQEYFNYEKRLYKYGTTTGIEAVSGKLATKVYPNPVLDVVNVELGATGNILITDLSGRTLISENVQHANGKAQINIGSLPAGVYLVKAQTITGTSVQKAIKK